MISNEETTKLHAMHFGNVSWRARLGEKKGFRGQLRIVGPDNRDALLAVKSSHQQRVPLLCLSVRKTHLSPIAFFGEPRNRQKVGRVLHIRRSAGGKLFLRRLETNVRISLLSQRQIHNHAVVDCANLSSPHPTTPWTHIAHWQKWAGR